MKNLARLTVAGGTIALFATLTTGCSTVQRGVAAGGALGAVAGAVAGNNSASVSVGQGAVIGGGTGAAVGGLTGDAYSQLTEDDVARELENMRAELERKEAELAALRESGVSADALAELDTLRGELDAARGNLETALADLATIGGERDAAQQQLASYQVDLSSTRADLDAAEDSLAERNGRLTDLEQNLAQTASQRDQFELQLRDAESQLAQAREDLTVIQASLQEKASAVDSLREELQSLNIELEETNRGLTLTIVDELIFTPGKAQLSESGAGVIAQVAALIQENFPGRELLVEGHTDNQPIVHSGWRSNWELGAARALSVLHELVEAHDFDPGLMSATSYGEFRPSAPNATPDGRSSNRRSVIVILPERMPVKRNQLAGL